MSQRHRRAGLPLWAGAILIALLTSAQAKAQQKIDWPDATAELNNLRPKAITCAGLIKRYGTRGEVAHARLNYANGKSEVDAIISGLTVALTADGRSGSLPSLQAHLTAASAKLQGLCATAQGRLPGDPGQKGVIDEIAKAAIEPLITSISNGIAALYTDHRSDSELTRKTIITQLEGARWPDFATISGR